MTEKVQILADKIEPMIRLIDMFVDELDDEDIDLLNQAEEILKHHISMQQSVMTLTLAFGMETDTLDEEYKLKTLNQLKEFIKLRKEYKDKLIKHNQEKLQLEKNRKEIMKIFENM